MVSDDNSGHGTRVAGIAAGNGSSGNFTGVAPEAKLIIVKALGGMLDNILEENLNTAGLLDAYAYIRTRADQLGMPYVINTSRGTTIGPHDGTTLLSQAVNAEVAAGAIIVVSAGNYSNDNWHGETTVPFRGSATFLVDVGANERSFYLDFWTESGDVFQIEVAGPSGEYTAAVSGESVATFYQEDGRITIVSKLNSPLNQDNEFLIRIYNPLSNNTIKAGRWSFRFTPAAGNFLPDGGEIDGWILRDSAAEFANYIDLSETIGELATSDSVISVAAFNNKTSPTGRISSFSSIGPRRDGVFKPDISAAGGGIVSCRSQQSDAGAYQGNSYYAYGSGTSFSAPHVAGAIALLLQMDPDLTAGQVKKILNETAKSDQSTGSTPNYTWGYGKLDVISLLRNYLSTAQFSGAVQSGGIPVSATLNIRPVDVEYPALERSVYFSPSDGNFFTTLLAGRYELSIFPDLPYTYQEHVLNIPLDTNSISRTFEVTIADVLLIDDESDNYEKYYIEVLNSLDLKFSLWPDTKTSAPPLFSTTKVIPDPIAIWFTGDESDSVLTLSEQDSIISFLQAGGRLLLSGQNIIESIDSSHFALQYLSSRFAGNTADHLLDNVISDPLIDGFPYLFTSGGGGAGNQFSSDILELTGPAEPFSYYDISSQKIAGIRLENDSLNWRTVFFAFGLEGVTVPLNRTDFLSREQLIANSIDWLDGEPVVSVRQPAGQAKNNLQITKNLLQIYPNPMTYQTEQLTIRYGLIDRKGNTTITIFNLLGRKVANIPLPDNLNEGFITWIPGENYSNRLPSGVYFFVLHSGSVKLSKKFLILH